MDFEKSGMVEVKNEYLVSYIFPHNNREELLEYNLKSLLCQTVKDFEIIITDNSLNKEKVKNVVSQFRKLGLNIKLYFVDPQLCPFSHDGSMYQNKFCPAIQQNVGVKKASGKIIVLTSPEIINASTNVENIINKLNDNESKFLYGWMDEMKKEEIKDVIQSDYDLHVIKKICENNVRDPINGGAWCKECECKPSAYFLGCMLRKDFIRVGGIDETFMSGIGWEDNEFAQRCNRNSIIGFFEENIGGIHLWHNREYQAFDVGGEWTAALTSINARRYAITNNLIANEGYNWGSDSYIVGEF